MSRTSWSGRIVRRLVDLTLANKGRTCHLCGLPGADSADHNPPRSELLRLGVPDPDHQVYLFPSHRLCNVRRQARPITPELRAELHRRRLVDVALAEAAAARSPRFVKAKFLRDRHPREAAAPSLFSHDPARKTARGGRR